jgi:hypothetical protein
VHASRLASQRRGSQAVAAIAAAAAFASAGGAAAQQAGGAQAAPIAAVAPRSVAEPLAPSEPTARGSGWALLDAEPPALVAKLLEEKVALLDAPRAPREPGGGLSRAYVVFEQPAARVFELLAETSRQREYRDELERIRTVQPLADGSIDEHAIRILFVEMVYHLRYRLDPAARRITWKLDPSFPNPMRNVEGSWEVYELGPARSLGRFGTAVDVGPALPAWLEEAVTRRNLPKTLEGCRRWIDAGGVAP